VAGDLTTVLQTAVAAGAGGSRFLSFQNLGLITQDAQVIRVASGGCTTGCDADDRYRIRVVETTGFIPRLNNSGTQVTILILQNNGAAPVNANVYYWTGGGGLAGTQPLTIGPHATAVVNTSAGAPATAGSMTVSHDGRYGQLTGKAVAVEPATGFTFDTEMRTRPR
jgi:hypothetical protein